MSGATDRLTYVLKIVDVIGMVLATEPGAAPGQYVRSYDPDGHDGRGDLVTTGDLDLALTFDGFGEAWNTWQATSTVRPLRPDGRPNRPLTAFTVEVARLDEERIAVAQDAGR